MAYGKGRTRALEKRLIDVGTLLTVGAFDLLRRRCLEALPLLAQAGFHPDATGPVPSGKDLDDVMLGIQAEITAGGLNSKWAEKCRLLAKTAVIEQIKRRRNTLIGKVMNLGARGERAASPGHVRWIQFEREVSETLAEGDIEAMTQRFRNRTPGDILALLGKLRTGDAGFPAVQAQALRAMLLAVEERFGCPVWSEDAEIQLHLDRGCVRGGAAAIAGAAGRMSGALRKGATAGHRIAMTGVSPRQAPIPLQLALASQVAERYADPDIEVTSFVVELGPVRTGLRAVIARTSAPADPAGFDTVLGEDFGFVNTSSMVVVRARDSVSASHLAFAASDPGKNAVRDFLAGHICGDEIEVLARLQFSGRNFLSDVAAHAARVDRLRSAIDQGYNRLTRIRRELNRLAGRDPEDLVPQDPDTVSADNADQDRYARTHHAFFALLAHLQRLKATRRGIYRTVAGLKKSWFGFVSNRKLALARAHGALIVSEDLSILAIETDDPAYRGRTFNRMLNNGSKGQYIRRSDQKARWRGQASVSVPSAWSSSTDWTCGQVDKQQRRGEIFKDRNGTHWDADLHAAEMLARWLFLRPKNTGAPAPA